MKFHIIIFSLFLSFLILPNEKSYGVDFGPLTGNWLEPAVLMDCAPTRIPCGPYGTNTLEWGGGPTPSSLLFEGVPFSFTEGMDEGNDIRIGVLTWDQTSIPGPSDGSIPDSLLVPLLLNFPDVGPVGGVSFSGLVTNVRNDLGPDDFANLGTGNAWEAMESEFKTGVEILGKISGTIIGQPLLALHALSSETDEFPPRLPITITEIKFGKVLFGPSRVIPEPATVFLFLTGLAGLGIWKARKRAK